MSDDRSTTESPCTLFEAAREQFESVVGWLGSGDAAQMTHAEVEARLDSDGRELLRQLFQGHLDLRAVREARRPEVTGSDGEARTHVRPGERKLTTVFGPVRVERLRLYEKALGIKRRAGLAARPSCAARPSLHACLYPHSSRDHAGPVHVGCSARRGAAIYGPDSGARRSACHGRSAIRSRHPRERGGSGRSSGGPGRRTGDDASSFVQPPSRRTRSGVRGDRTRHAARTRSLLRSGS